MRPFLALVLALGFGCGKSPVGVAKVHWHTDVDAAVATAKAEHKPLFIYFGAEWDTGTKELETHTFVDPEVAALLSRQYVSAKVDATDYDDPRVAELSRRYNTVGVPTLIILGPDGTSEITRINSYVEGRKLATALRAATKEDAVREARFEAAARRLADDARAAEARRKADLAGPAVTLTVDIPPAP